MVRSFVTHVQERELNASLGARTNLVVSSSDEGEALKSPEDEDEGDDCDEEENVKEYMKRWQKLLKRLPRVNDDSDIEDGKILILNFFPEIFTKIEKKSTVKRL